MIRAGVGLGVDQQARAAVGDDGVNVPDASAAGPTRSHRHGDGAGAQRAEHGDGEQRTAGRADDHAVPHADAPLDQPLRLGRHDRVDLTPGQGVAHRIGGVDERRVLGVARRGTGREVGEVPLGARRAGRPVPMWSVHGW